MGYQPRRPVLTLVSFLLAAASMGAQELKITNPYQVNYKRFLRGNDTKLVDDAQGRIEWWRERMGGDLGPDFTRHLLVEAERERNRFPFLFPKGRDIHYSAPLGTGTWVNIGPTGSDFTYNGVTLTKVDSGRLRTILIDDSDATGNTVYILASGGGLWKSTNFLNASPTWSPLTDFVGTNLSGSVAFGRTKSTLYFGTGDAFDAGVGGFFIKSADSGATWSTAVQLGNATRSLDLQVDTSQAQDIILIGTDQGLFRSTDAGATFSQVATLNTGKVWSIVKTSAGWLAAQSNSSRVGTLYKSTDQGATWTAISSSVYTGAGRTTLAVGAPGDSTVYAFAAATGDNSQLDLFKSTDGGATWSALGLGTKTPSNPNSNQANLDVMAGQAFYNHMILVDPSDSNRNTVYLGGQLASVKSTDGGTTWKVITDWLPGAYSDTADMPYAHADFHCAAFSNLGGTKRLYFGTDGGVFVSADGGTTWDDSKNKGLVTHLIYALAANPGTAGSALVGLQDNGTRLRAGTTATFNQVQGGDGFGVGWSQANNAVAMSSYVYNKIKRATNNPPDAGNKWSNFTSGLSGAGSDNTSYYFVTPIVTPSGAADPSGLVHFTYGSGGSGSGAKQIYKSSNTGWTPIMTSGSGGVTSGLFVRAVSHGVGIHPTDLNRIAAATNGGYVIITTDGGTNWTTRFLGSNGSDGLCAGWYGFNANVAWVNNSIIYVASESSSATAAHVAKTTDGGATWTRMDTGLPTLPVTKLVVDPGDSTGNTLYAATWIGVYRTTNGGTSWSRFGSGLPQCRVTDIWIAPDSSVIRVSTWGRGVWELAPAAGPAVTLSPGTANAAPGATLTFTAAISNGSTNGLTWTASGGSWATATTTGANPTNTWTAPASGGPFSLTVTTQDTPTATASATVTLTIPTVALTPTAATVLGGATQNFTATVTNGTTNGLNWSVTGGTLSSATTSTASANNTWTAPASGGPYTLTVTTQDLPANSKTATLTVIPPSAISLVMNTPTKTMLAGETVTFTVTGDAGQGVTWTKSNGLTGTGSGLSIPVTTPTTTPLTTSTYTVTATSTLDSSKTATATITVKGLDLDGNGVLDVRDLLLFGSRWGNNAGDAANFKGTGTVDNTDLVYILGKI